MNAIFNSYYLPYSRSRQAGKYFLHDFQRRLIFKSFAEESSVPHFPQPEVQFAPEKPRNFIKARRPAKNAAAKITRKTRIVCQSTIT